MVAQWFSGFWGSWEAPFWTVKTAFGFRAAGLGMGEDGLEGRTPPRRLVDASLAAPPVKPEEARAMARELEGHDAQVGLQGGWLVREVNQ